MQGSSENAGKLLYNKRLRIDALHKRIRTGAAFTVAALRKASGNGSQAPPDRILKSSLRVSE